MITSSLSLMGGTDEERMLHRRRAFAMVQNQGSPALMLTVSPNDQGWLAISYLAGGIKNTHADGSEIKLEELYLPPEAQLPTQPKRLALLAADPTVPQRFFDRTVHLLLEHFLGLLRSREGVSRPHRISYAPALFICIC